MNTLFDIENRKNQNKEWEQEFKDMPSYNNKKEDDPFITATFKFRNKKDFDFFNEFLKTNLYKTKKVFDGNQTKTKKSTWFPLKQKASNYLVI